jgi:STE24 endopeptidase
MPAGPLRTDLLAMARRDGVPVGDVLVADASKRTTELNAYVSGFGSTRRIVVYDTLLSSEPRTEIELIVAHELGHAKRDDVLHGTLVGALGAAAGVCVLFLVLTSPRLLRRAGADSPADPRSVALLLTAVTVLLQVAGPVENLVSRRIEARADMHALDLTRDPETYVRMQRSLSARNLDDLSPNALEYGLWNSHPTGPQRIAMGRDWARLHHVPVPAPLVNSTSP